MGKRTTATRHKSENTFRFRGQKERQKSIVVNRLGNIRDWLRDDDEDDEQSFLYKAMLHWQDLNLYTEFRDILNEIGSDVKLLAQVLHQKERIVDIIVSKICGEAGGYLEALYGLLTALVSDLRQEFVPSLPMTLEKINGVILSSTDADIIALSFDCYSRLLKELKSAVVKNFNTYFKIFVPLLRSRVKGYVVKNAVKSISFVCSKFCISNATVFLRRVHKSLESSGGDLENGIALLLNEMVSDGGPKTCLDICLIIKFVDEVQGETARWEALVLYLIKVMSTSKKVSAKEITLDRWNKIETVLTSELLTRRFEYGLRILSTMYENQERSTLTSTVDVQARLVHLIIQNKSLWENNVSYRAELMNLICNTLNVDLCEPITKTLLESVLPALDLEQLHYMNEHFQSKCSKYSELMHLFGNAYRRIQTTGSSDKASHALLSWYSNLIVNSDGGIQLPDCINPSVNGYTGLSLPCYYFGKEPRRPSVVSHDFSLDDILKPGGIQLIKSAINNPEELTANEQTYLRFLVVLQQVNLKDHSDIQSALIELFDSILANQEFLKGGLRYTTFLYLILEALTLSNSFEDLKGKHIKNFLEMLSNSAVFCDTSSVKNSNFYVWTLKIVDLVLYNLSRIEDHNQHSLIQYYGLRPEELAQKLEDNLLSGFKVIRCLTLSVLLRLSSYRSSSCQELESFLRLAIDNELCELDLTNLNHTSNYLEMESCLKNIRPENDVDIQSLVTAMKYIIGCLFHNHAKIMQTCRDTLAPIVLSKLPVTAFWGIISERFIAIHSTGFVEPKSFIQPWRSEDTSCSDFWKVLTTKAFGFQKSEFTSLGQEVKSDYARLKVNLWSLINNVGLKLPVDAQNLAISCVKELHKQITSQKPYVGIREDPSAKELIPVMLPALEFLNLYPGKKGPSFDHRREICLAMLMGNKALHKIAVSILRKISPTIHSFLTKIEKIGEDNWLKSIHLKSFEGPDAFFIPEDRQMFVDFIVRSLIALKAEIKGNCMSYIISFLHGFTEAEVMRQVEFLFGGESAWKECTPDLGLLKYLKGHLKSICKMVAEWRYQFPNIVAYLMELVCLFVDTISEDKSTTITATESADHAISQRKKAILSLARSVVVNFFSLFEKLPISEDLIQRIFRSFIFANEAETGIYSSDSISWYFQLMMTWSRVPRFHVLFIKSKDENPDTNVMSDLFGAFNSKFLKSSVYTHLMEIITNLGMIVEDELDSGEVHDTDLRLFCGKTIPITETGDRLGERILHHFKDRLLKVVTSTNFFQEKMFVGGKTEAYIEFLRLCAKFSTNAESNHKLCLTIIPLLRKFNKRPPELIGLFELIQELISRSTSNNTIALKLSQCLCWTQEKGPREALCSAISEAMVNKHHATLISNLNAYTTKVGDSLDYETIQSAFQKCAELISEPNGFKNIFVSIVANTCFYYLTYEADIGILAATEGMLSTVAEEITKNSQSGKDRELIHNFLDGIVVPRLKWGIKSKSDEVFKLYLKVLSIFSHQCFELHGALRGAHAVFQHDDKDLLIDLQELQLATRIKAVNRFQYLWPIMRTHPSAVVDFAIPILSHNLMEKTKLKVSLQNFLQCSLEAIKWCVVSLPHGAYFKYLESIMESIPDDEQLLKQYHKLLGLILDGYHYELDDKLLEELDSRLQVIQDTNLEVEKNDDEGMDVNESIQDETKEVNLDTVSVTVKLNYHESKSLLKLIECKFIPKLRKYLHLEEKASHKLARASAGEDSLIKKIPTTLAYVKLLNKLPAKIRKSHTVWVIPTLCSSLNSRLISVRSNVRNTLLKIVEELGPEVFPDIVKATKAYLVRGFQKHVRNFTLLNILKQLQDAFTLKPYCVPVASIVPIVEDELFGYMSEDKDVREILKNTPEAKSQNGLQLLFYCAKFVNFDSLSVLLQCPVERVKTAKNLETLKIVKSWMTEVANGLADNTGLTSIQVLHFLKTRLDSDCAGGEKVPSEKKQKQNSQTKYLEAPVDAYLLPAGKSTSPRQGVFGVVSAVSWFAYSCLYNILKRENFENNAESLKLLDDLARSIVMCDNDEALEIRAPTVRSLILMYQFPLKCFMDTQFVTAMWRKYFMCVNNAVSNEDINMYYKFLTSFFLTFTEFQLDGNDFSLLIKCINKHLHENKCTGSALVLVRNILHRSLDSKDLQTLIKEIKRRICSSDSIHVQEGCRAAFVVYVKNYLKTQEEFVAELYDFFKVLGYRKSLQDIHSVYKMIASLITVIPESWVRNISSSVGMDFVLALMKSTDEESQKLICNSCMKNLFERMTKNDGLKLVEELLETSNRTEMMPYQREICLTVSKIIEHGKSWESEAVMSTLLKILRNVLTPSDLLMLQARCKNLKGTHRDFGIYEAIVASRRALELLARTNSFTDSIIEQIQELMHWVRSDYLKHQHESIQEASLQFFNLQLSLFLQLRERPGRKSKLVGVMSSFVSEDNLLEITKLYIKMGGYLDEGEMQKNVLLGLKLLVRLVCDQCEKPFHDNLVKALRFSVNLEIRKTPQTTRSRETVYQFVQLYVSLVPEECLSVVQQNLMNITTRELTDKNTRDDTSLVTDMCTSIHKKLEERVGRQVFLQLYEQSRSALQNKRENNRAKKKEQIVLSMDPRSVVTFRTRKRKSKSQANTGKAKKKRGTRN